ncbi:MAG TPA: hypothetical protein VGG72_36110 [Bryobacteraceae bacterium]|jgi:hypothetical protein
MNTHVACAGDAFFLGDLGAVYRSLQSRLCWGLQMGEMAIGRGTLFPVDVFGLSPLIFRVLGTV